MVVATVRALKNHGGVAKADLNQENLEALEKGLPNLLQHVDNIKNVFGLPCVVAINAFPTDTAAELVLVEEKCRELGVSVALSEVWAKGGEGGLSLAEEVVRLCESPNEFRFAYDAEAPIEEKLKDLPRRRGGAHRRRPEADEGAGGAGVRQAAHLHGEDAVQLLRRRIEAGGSQRVHRHGAES